MKRVALTTLSSLALVLMLASVYAQVSYNSDTLPSTFTQGESITGALNVTFSATNLDSALTTNFGNSISLRTLLDAHHYASYYNCSTSTCLPSYVSQGDASSLDFSGGNKLIGFVMQGKNVDSVQSTKLIIKSNAAPSCFLDLGVDILNKQEYVLTSSRYIDEACYDARYGCFETTRNDYLTVTMAPNVRYCENITLPVAPAFRLGTRLIKSTQGSPALKIGLYSADGALLKDCTLPQPSQDNENIECIVPYSTSTQGDYFVCLQATGTSNYKIRTETNAPCGTNDFATYPGDYELYAKNLKFDTPQIEISQASFFNKTGASLDDYINTYIADTYGNSCTPSCALPFRIFGAPQNLNVTNVYMKYSTSLGLIETSSVSSLEQGKVTITSGPLVLDLTKANFTLPSNAQGSKLKITIDGREIVNKPISISSGFSFDINTYFAIFGRDTLFSITGANITSAQWDFGDGVTNTASGASQTHRYTHQGTYVLIVHATRSDGLTTTRTFTVSVGDPRTAANVTLVQAQNNFINLTKELGTMAPWLAESLKSELGYDEMNLSLHQIEARYAVASSDDEYAAVVSNLVTLNIPTTLTNSVTGTLPLLVASADIDTSIIEDISNRQVAQQQDLAAAINGWMNEHTDADINFESIFAQYTGASEPLATRFTIHTRPKDTFSEQTYLVLPFTLDDLHFASQSYGAKGVDGGTYIPLDDHDQTIEFLILDAVSVEELGSYITPAVDSLGTFDEPESAVCNADKTCATGETYANCPSDCKPWGRIIGWIVALIVVGFIAWLGLQWWYKQNYERTLFPNKQDLVNVLNYIHAAHQKDMDDKELRKKLKNAGWDGEQISYALKKAKKFKPVVGRTDTRFIKRPEFR